MSTCIACGREGKTEQHHVGRRKFSDVLIGACISCHNDFTIADVYERKWSTDNRTDHLAMGFLDILARACANWGLTGAESMAHNAIKALAPIAGFTTVPAARQAQDPDTGWVMSSLPQQIAEINRVFAEVMR
jgi:hypothetical protein